MSVISFHRRIYRKSQKVGAGETAATLAEHVAASERRHIAETLAANGGRIADTAARLGISRKNLWEKMKKYDIRPPTNVDEA
jgi:DNA-binding NtrC family response regulator